MWSSKLHLRLSSVTRQIFLHFFLSGEKVSPKWLPFIEALKLVFVLPVVVPLTPFPCLLFVSSLCRTSFQLRRREDHLGLFGESIHCTGRYIFWFLVDNNMERERERVNESRRGIYCDTREVQKEEKMGQVISGRRDTEVNLPVV